METIENALKTIEQEIRRIEPSSSKEDVATFWNRATDGAAEAGVTADGILIRSKKWASMAAISLVDFLVANGSLPMVVNGFTRKDRADSRLQETSNWYVILRGGFGKTRWAVERLIDSDEHNLRRLKLPVFGPYRSRAKARDVRRIMERYK